MTERLSLAEVKERNSDRPLRQATLCFLIKGETIVLAMKKRGFATGRWNGLGGKPEPEDRNIEETAIRETFEESHVTPKNMKQVGVLNFYFETQTDWNQQVVVFLAHEWEGIPEETEEMNPMLFKTNKIPYDQMWEDDKFWLPKVLDGKIIEGNFLFDENQKILEYEITEIT